MNETTERIWSSREFIIALALIVVGVVLVLSGHKDEGLELIMWIGLGYIGSRTAIKVTGVAKAVGK